MSHPRVFISKNLKSEKEKRSGGRGALIKKKKKKKRLCKTEKLLNNDLYCVKANSQLF